MKNKSTASKIGLLAGKKKKAYDEIAFLIGCVLHQISLKTKKKKLPFSGFKFILYKSNGKRRKIETELWALTFQE